MPGVLHKQFAKILQGCKNFGTLQKKMDHFFLFFLSAVVSKNLCKICNSSSIEHYHVRWCWLTQSQYHIGGHQSGELTHHQVSHALITLHTITPLTTSPMTRDHTCPGQRSLALTWQHHVQQPSVEWGEVSEEPGLVTALTAVPATKYWALIGQLVVILSCDWTTCCNTELWLVNLL